MAKEYRESFGGEQVSKDFAMAAAMGLMPKSAEDPATVLRNLQAAADELKQPGRVDADDAKTQGAILDAIKEIGAKLSAVDKFLTN